MNDTVDSILSAKETEGKIWKAVGKYFGFKMVTTEGTPIEFVGFAHVTQNEEIAKYLAKELRAGNPALVSVKEVKQEELDPEYEARQRIIAEYLQQQADAVSGNGTEPAAIGLGTTASVTPTKQLAEQAAKIAASATAKVQS